MHACMHGWMCGCMDVWMYVCMYVSLWAWRKMTHSASRVLWLKHNIKPLSYKPIYRLAIQLLKILILMVSRMYSKSLNDCFQSWKAGKYGGNIIVRYHPGNTEIGIWVCCYRYQSLFHRYSNSNHVPSLMAELFSFLSQTRSLDMCHGVVSLRCLCWGRWISWVCWWDTEQKWDN